MKDTIGRNNRKIPDAICANCGKPFRPKKATSKYCSRPCMWVNNGGANKKEESWWVNGKGYIEGRVWIDKDTQVRVKKHRWIMENHLGRKLNPEEDVHHINGDKQDNRVENLMVVSHSEHASITNHERDYSNHKKKEFSEDERKSRSERAKRLHREGKMMTPQANAALAKARGE